MSGNRVRRLIIAIFLLFGGVSYLFADTIPALLYYVLLVPFIFAVIITVTWGLAKLSLAFSSS